MQASFPLLQQGLQGQEGLQRIAKACACSAAFQLVESSSESLSVCVPPLLGSYSVHNKQLPHIVG